MFKVILFINNFKIFIHNKKQKAVLILKHLQVLTLRSKILLNFIKMGHYKLL